MSGIAARVFVWFDERLDLSAVRERLRSKSVPTHRYSVLYLLGGATLLFFGIQVVTGVLLMAYYRPSAHEAWESIDFISTRVHFGWLVRSVHSWSAHLMIFFAIVHLVTVFFMRAYRKPRELTWISGCLMLFLLLGFGFSGYLLPWNQLAFFATKVGVEMARWTPLVGEWVYRLLVGGDRVGGSTLLRFYTLHVFVLPMLTFGLVALHLHLVQRHGMSVPRSIRRRDAGGRTVPFLDFLLRDALLWLVLLGALLILATRFPADIGGKADPFAPAQENIRPEWYFMFIFQSLRVMPAGSILGIPLEALPFFLIHAGAGVLLAVPFLDRSTSRERRSLVLTGTGVAALGYFVAMTAWGYGSWIPLAVAAGTAGTIVALVAATAPRRSFRG